MNNNNHITLDELKRIRNKYERSCVERDQAWKDYCADPCEEMYDLYISVKDEEQKLEAEIRALCADVSWADGFFLIDFRPLTPAEIKAGQELEELAQEVLRKEQLRIENVVKDYIRLVYPWAVTARIREGIFMVYSDQPKYAYETWMSDGADGKMISKLAQALHLDKLTEEEERDWRMDF